MRGFPKTLATRQDVTNVIAMVQAGELDRNEALAALDNLVATKDHYVLKETSIGKPAEELTQDDYQLESDPNSQMVRLGLTVDEINELKGGI